MKSHGDRQTDRDNYSRAFSVSPTHRHQTSMSERAFYAISAFVDYAANACWGFSLIFVALMCRVAGVYWLYLNSN